MTAIAGDKWMMLAANVLAVPQCPDCGEHPLPFTRYNILLWMEEGEEEYAAAAIENIERHGGDPNLTNALLRANPFKSVIGDN